MADLQGRLQSALGDAYHIERELGRGGMASVYLAEDRKHHRLVAIKVLKPELAAALGPERFLREIETAAQLTHPHILPLHDSGQAQGLLYYVMPYVEGESLRERLKREGQLPLEDALRIAREVASALSHAHSHDVVHRDIKPENILVSGGEAVVADFGIARAITAAGGDKLTETGIAIGTPAYMSPEQAAGSRELDGRSDIYNLGCVLYEMLAGQPPFTGRTAESVVHQHLTVEAPPVTRMRATVPPAVVEALGRALAKAPADRFAAATQFADALASPSAPTTGRRARRSRPGRLVGASAAVLVIIAASVWWPWLGRKDRAASGANPDRASVAVLPFENIGGRPEEEYFSEGITEEIITQLAQVKGLKVISRISVVALKGSRLTLPQIADTLKVRHIVEGTIRRAGDSIRVSVQLIDAKTDAHLWAASYDRRLIGIFGVQEEIARRVSGALLATVQGLRSRSSASRTEQTAAYDAYLQGRYWLQKRTPEGFARALTAFNEAIAIDSTYAPAYAALSALHSLCYSHRACPPEVIDDSVTARAVRFANRAIALDSGLAEGYAARGFAATEGNGPIEVGLTDLEQALRLRPNSGEIHLWNGVALSLAGHFSEALAQADTALSLDPLAPGLHTGYAILALNARRPEAALRQARRAKALEPALLNAVRFEALALLILGRASECAALDLRRFPVIKAMCLHTTRHRVEAAVIIDSLRRAIPPGNRRAMADMAIYYAWIGNSDSAAAWYGRAHGVGAGQWFFPSELFDRVRDDRGFQSAMQQVNARERAHFLDYLQQTAGGAGR